MSQQVVETVEKSCEGGVQQDEATNIFLDVYNTCRKIVEYARDLLNIVKMFDSFYDIDVSIDIDDKVSTIFTVTLDTSKFLNFKLYDVDIASILSMYPRTSKAKTVIISDMSQHRHFELRDIKRVISIAKSDVIRVSIDFAMAMKRILIELLDSQHQLKFTIELPLKMTCSLLKIAEVVYKIYLNKDFVVKVLSETLEELKECVKKYNEIVNLVKKYLTIIEMLK